MAQRIGGIKEIQPSHYGNQLASYRTKAFREKELKCEICGIIDWMGKDIVFDVHHKDGNRCNNNIENLMIICPNCHRQFRFGAWYCLGW